MLYGVAFGVLILDLLSKVLLEALIPPFGLVVIPGFFSLVKVRRPGVAFGLFRELGAPGVWLWAVLGFLAAGLILWWGRAEEDKGRRLALGMIAGGALGNSLDRVLHGAVFDFVDLHWGPYHWPAFNLADAAITIGVGIYLWRFKR